MKTALIIPARLASKRFDRKLLQDLCGKTVIQRVWEKAIAIQGISRCVIATDSAEICEHGKTFGASVIMTSPAHRSGTDRCAELAAGLEDIDIIINIQGDEPFLEGDDILAMIDSFRKHTEREIVSLYCESNNQEEFVNRNAVKVVVDKNEKALYFSRSPIPYDQNSDYSFCFKRHIGVYGFRKSILLKIAKLTPTNLEQSESLEQLRWVENGYSVHMIKSSYNGFGIDTREDLETARKYFKDNLRQNP